jgi:formylmethanofuran dehydrogenase subunit E
MNPQKLDEKTIDELQRFHGHMCPGLAIGIRASELALEEIGPHSKDEEIVAVVETDMCGVDAIQFLTGCTFGKGNLIHRDYGKNAFSFYRRSDALQLELGRKILEAPLQSLFEIKEPPRDVPRKARIMSGRICRRCGERAMETRMRLYGGDLFCVPFFEEIERR